MDCWYSLQTNLQDILQHVCVIITRHGVADCILGFFLVWEVILKKSVYDHGSMAVKQISSLRCKLFKGHKEQQKGKSF